jgi:hypothetical protein
MPEVRVGREKTHTAKRQEDVNGYSPMSLIGDGYLHDAGRMIFEASQNKTSTSA